MSSIKFGTDGWRAIIGKDFTPENISKVIQAFADIYPSLKGTGHSVTIGYDRRAKSKETAELTAKILTGNGIRTVLSDQFCPTPCVSWMVKEDSGTAGIMITASHNPPEWNGIKFKESYGGAASPDYTAPIEAQIKKNDTENRKAAIKELPNDLLSTFSPKERYLDAIKNFVDLKKIAECNFKVLAEPMFGSGCGFFPEFLGSAVTEIHNAADTSFGGIQPEPIPPHINEAMQKMKSGEFDIGLVTDGDADRIGAIDEKGNFVNPHQIFSLILKHFVEVKGWKGRVIKSLTTTRMLNNLCEKFGLPLETTPVGFKYISPKLNEPDVLMGGEESGGIGIPRHVCERDGVLCGLLLLEIMATRGKKISELVADLQEEAGPFFYRRDDLHLDDATVANAKKRLAELDINELAGRKIVGKTTMDGWHFLRDDDSWLLIRGSGTEPLLRTYAEARTPEDVDTLLNLAKEFIGI